MDSLFSHIYLQALQGAGIDWFSFETIPAQKEGEALVRLLTEEFCDMKAWLSYSCQVYCRAMYLQVFAVNNTNFQVY